MHQVFDSVASAGCSPASAPNGVAFRHLNDVGTRNENLSELNTGPACTPAVATPTCYHDQRTTQGQRAWLGLRCKTLSFSTPSRFIPALSQVSFSRRLTANAQKVM